MNSRLFRATLVLELKYISKAWRFWLALLLIVLTSLLSIDDRDGSLGPEDYGRGYLFMMTLFAFGVSAAIARGTRLLELAMSRPASPRVVLSARFTAYTLVVATVGLVLLALNASTGRAEATFVSLVVVGTLLGAVSYALVTEPRSTARAWVWFAVATYSLSLVFPWSAYEVTLEPWMIVASPFAFAACILGMGFAGWSGWEPVSEAESSSWWRRSGWTFGLWLWGLSLGLVLLVVLMALLFLG